MSYKSSAYPLSSEAWVTRKSEKAVVYFCLQPLAFPAYAETLGKLIINNI